MKISQRLAELGATSLKLEDLAPYRHFNGFDSNFCGRVFAVDIDQQDLARRLAVVDACGDGRAAIANMARPGDRHRAVNMAERDIAKTWVKDVGTHRLDGADDIGILGVALARARAAGAVNRAVIVALFRLFGGVMIDGQMPGCDELGARPALLGRVGQARIKLGKGARILLAQL